MVVAGDDGAIGREQFRAFGVEVFVGQDVVGMPHRLEPVDEIEIGVEVLRRQDEGGAVFRAQVEHRAEAGGEATAGVVGVVVVGALQPVGDDVVVLRLQVLQRVVRHG